MHHPMFVHDAMLLIVPFFLLCELLLLDRRRRWDRRALRVRFRGVSPAPGWWVCRQVFTHMNHCYRLLTGYRFFPLSILLALFFDACVSIPSHVTSQPWYGLTSTSITLLLVGLCRTSMLSVVWARVCCSLSVNLFSMIDGLDFNAISC